MLFEEKSKKVTFLTYSPDRRIIERKIGFKRLLAEEINEVIAVFNKESEVVKINNSTLVNIAINCLFKQLKGLSEEEIVEMLKEKALNEATK